MSTNFNQDLLTRNTIKVGNASDRLWTHVYDSSVWPFNPGEVKTIGPKLGPPLDEFGAPMKDLSTQAIGPDGRPVGGAAQKVVKAGCNTDDIVKSMLDAPGSPLYPILMDGKDPQRANAAREKYLTYHVTEAQKLVDTHRAYCENNNKYNIANPPMPGYIRDCVQLLKQHAREVKIDRKRYICILDGAQFDFYDEAKEWILDPIAGHPRVAATWADYIRDTEGGAHVYRNPAGITHVEPTVASVPVTAEGHFPSIAAQGILALADKAEVSLPQELVDRLDSDETAVEEAMDIIMSAGTKKKRAKAAA